MICLIALSKEQQAQWSLQLLSTKKTSQDELRQIREMLDKLEDQNS